MSELSKNALSGFSILLATLSLAACGGGGGSSSSDDKNDSPTGGGSGQGSGSVAVEAVLKPGIFVTTITEGDSEQQALTLLSSSGRYAVYTNSLAGIFGTLTFRGDDTFSGGGKNVFLDETDNWQSIVGTLEGSATSSTDSEFNAILTAKPDINSELLGVRFDELSDLQVTMSELYGTYSLIDSSMSVTIEPDASGGNITGSTRDGCVISGAVDIPDPNYNIFEANLLFEMCPDVSVASSNQRNGNYQTIGYLRPLGNGGKRLIFAGTNDDVITLFSGDN